MCEAEVFKVVLVRSSFNFLQAAAAAFRGRKFCVLLKLLAASLSSSKASHPIAKAQGKFRLLKLRARREK